MSTAYQDHALRCKIALDSIKDNHHLDSITIEPHYNKEESTMEWKVTATSVNMQDFVSYDTELTQAIMNAIYQLPQSNNE